MIYNKKIELNHIDLTENNIQRLVEVINQQTQGEIYLSSYEIEFYDNSKIESEKEDVFNEFEFKNKPIERIYINVIDEKRNKIEISLFLAYKNYILIKASNKTWFNETCNIINETVKTFKKQNPIYYVVYGGKYFLLFIIVLSSILNLLIIPIFNKLIPEKYEILPSVLAILIVIPTINIILKIIDNAYPKVALDFGSKDNQKFKTERKKLQYAVFSILLPILMDIYLYFLL